MQKKIQVVNNDVMRVFPQIGRGRLEDFTRHDRWKKELKGEQRE
jgi:hypothetical protein